MGAQFRDPGVVIVARADCRVEFIVIGNVVTVQTVRSCLKIWRCVNIAHTQFVQVRHDLACLREREPAVELQPVRATGNPRMLCLHERKKRRTLNAERPTSNSNSDFDVRRSMLGVRRFFTFSPVL